MSSRAKKISKNSQMKNDKLQLDLLTQYFKEYQLMNHYQCWIESRIAKTKPPRRLDMKIFFNPLMKLFRKSTWQRKSKQKTKK